MTDLQINQTALPNDLPTERLWLRPDAAGMVAVDRSAAGWRYLSFRTIALPSGASLQVGSAARETAVVNLFGGDVLVVGADGRRDVLQGRPSVFDALPTAFYLPMAATATLTAIGAAGGLGATIAIADAPGRAEVAARLKPLAIGRSDIRVEIRGAGHSTRRIHHLIAPGFPADRLLIVEVLTPSGNWSSWPPHKHDVDDMPNEAVLEEVYHYRFRRPEAWAIQRVYRVGGGPLGDARDGIYAVQDGDVVLVTDGYHPFAATDADDAYYLNALAGDRRTMACSFDPALELVRDRWGTEEPDPRAVVDGNGFKAGGHRDRV